VIVPPSPRYPHERYQVRYQDGTHQRSAGIFPTMRRAEAEQRALERTGRDQLPRPTEPDPAKARTLFGEYVMTKWWPAWRDQYPSSEYGTRKKVEKRILPPFGDIPLGELDSSTIGAWKATMVAEGLRPRTVNTYLSLLGTILNAAVDDDYLARSPLVRKSGAGRTAATRNQPVPRREVWLVREQLDRLADPIDLRYRALVLVAALTGMRWGELVALRWDEPRFDQPLNDGAVAGPARLRITRAISDPRRTGRVVEKGPKTEAGKRVIALDQETIQAFLTHREVVGGDDRRRRPPGAHQRGRDHDGVRPPRQAGRPRAADDGRTGTGGADASTGRRAGASSGLAVTILCLRPAINSPTTRTWCSRRRHRPRPARSWR
jgi:integrase